MAKLTTRVCYVYRPYPFCGPDPRENLSRPFQHQQQQRRSRGNASHAVQQAENEGNHQLLPSLGMLLYRVNTESTPLFSHLQQRTPQALTPCSQPEALVMKSLCVRPHGVAPWARERALCELFDYQSGAYSCLPPAGWTLLAASSACRLTRPLNRITSCPNRINLVPHTALTFLEISSESQRTNSILSLQGQCVWNFQPC